ncbi:hypothetical protein [Maricaulis sp.]|uniref:hypothetical protein n=1 Tax=Maricaulis sp. TaxID=1486257 RepID=UPI002603B026|nr:hypothetical protein [Maricaulis sp.]
MIKFILAAGAAVTLAQDEQPRPDLTALIAEARNIAVQHGETVWTGYADAPGTIILIDGETEFLLCHDGPAEGFTRLQRDDVTGCALARRDRNFPPNFLASFPAVDGTPSIVVGTPEGTGRTPDDWMVTLLHERVHQYQDSQPDSFARAMALDLHGGDQTGMWQINYAFPYEDADTAAAVRQLADLALMAVQQRGEPGFEAAAQDFVRERQAFLASIDPADARYYDFQSWKEGVARWSELAIARAGAEDSARLAGFAAAQNARMIRGLEAVDLPRQGRVAFYALGSAEAEILEHLDPAWRSRYLDEMYDMSALFQQTLSPE